MIQLQVDVAAVLPSPSSEEHTKGGRKGKGNVKVSTLLKDELLYTGLNTRALEHAPQSTKRACVFST